MTPEKLKYNAELIVAWHYSDFSDDTARWVLKALHTIQEAINDIQEVTGMEPELDHPSLQLYRVDGRDMQSLKLAQEKLIALFRPQ